MPQKPILTNISQCDKSLRFRPRRPWPEALPAFCWRGMQLCAFERTEGWAVELGGGFVEAFRACHPELGLAELARVAGVLPTDWLHEFGDALFTSYGLRGRERLFAVFEVLRNCPFSFQEWVDARAVGTRDLAPLLALPDLAAFAPFLMALVELPFSKSQGVQALEWGSELFLLDRPLNDLLPHGEVGAYLRRLEQWRRPRAAASDERWRRTVGEWPWPSQVQGVWQRFGDQAGLEIKIRTTSPQDLQQKLERLRSIQGQWSTQG